MELFTLPFMLRALIGGTIVAALLAYFGIFAMLRRSSFFGDAIAHSSLTGVAIGILFGFDPLLTAIIYAILVSFVIPYVKENRIYPLIHFLGSFFLFDGNRCHCALNYTRISTRSDEFSFGSILSIGWGVYHDIFYCNSTFPSSVRIKKHS
jgi:ABC-type Mn2+/Zn2+ transport system permease subunit